MQRICVLATLMTALGTCIGAVAAEHELVLVKENRITALMDDGQGDDKLEASGVDAFEGRYYVVFDNEKTVAVIDDRSWSENGPDGIGSNRFVDGGRKSEGVALASDDRRLFLIDEERLRSGEGQPPVRNGRVFEYLLSPEADLLEPVNRSWLPFDFERKNKGFEGVSLVRHDDAEFLLALCEGNDCAGKSRGRTPGRGRIEVFTRNGDAFDHAFSIELPRSLPFVDFSGMDVRDGMLALVSQETSALWVGRLDLEHGRVRDDGDVYTFPKSKDGAVTYCNVEGVAWIDDDRLVVVSDARKTREQPPSCAAKEQSIHVFRLPVR